MNLVSHLWRQQKRGLGDDLSFFCLFWIIMEWLKSTSLYILLNSPITPSAYINTQKIYIYITSWNALRDPHNESTACQCTLFLTVQQPAKLRLTSPGSLKSVSLASAWIWNYYLTVNKFHYHSKVLIFKRRLWSTFLELWRIITPSHSVC